MRKTGKRYKSKKMKAKWFNLTIVSGHWETRT